MYLVLLNNVGRLLFGNELTYDSKSNQIYFYASSMHG